MSGPLDTTSISQVNDIWQQNIQCVRQTIDRPQTAEDLIVEALTSAHRAQSNDYASNGNRELAGFGQTALGACIQFGRNSGRTEFSKQARHEGSWAKLGTHQGLLQIASRSPMRHCLVPSIRQHNASSSSPASKKVVAYVFRSLIGAVYLDSGRDREATSHALNALCRFLDSAQPPDQGSRLPSSISSSSGHGSGTNPEELTLEAQGSAAFEMDLAFDSEFWSQVASEISLDYVDVDFPWGAPSPSCLQPQSHSGQDPLDADSTRHQLAGTDCSQQIPNARTLGCASDVLLEDSGFGMQKLSLAHAAEGKQKSFVVTPPQAIEAPAEPCHMLSCSSPINPTPTPSITTPPASTTESHPKKPRATRPRYRNHQRLDDYVSSQLRRAKNTWPVSPVDGSQILPTIHQSFIRPSKTQRFQVTMRKLHLGTASSFVIRVIKTAICARRSATLSKKDVQSHSPSHTSYHFLEVVRLRVQRAQNSIEALYHTYELYRSLIEGAASELADGFVHSDQQELAHATASKKRKRSGNPLKARTTKLYNDMIAALEPDFDRKTEEEQAYLKRDVEKLRLLGVRLDALVRRFGRGVLCLIPFSNSVVDSESAVAITEAEFWDLPETSLIEMCTDMTRNHHPLQLFSQAARPILQLLVNEITSDTRRFRCEYTETVQIKDMVDGSSELLSQLEPV